MPTPPRGPTAPPVPLRPDPRPDLLAAHSMDSQWFIVDANGDVLLMETGEAGGMPQGIEPQSDASMELAELLRREIDDEGHGVFEADWDLPFVYVRQSTLPPKRWDELPQALRDAVGHLRVPVSLRDAAVIDLGEHLDPEGLQYWSDLLEALNEVDPAAVAPELQPIVQRYAPSGSDDDDGSDWVFPPPATPGTVVPPVERKRLPPPRPRPASDAGPAASDAGPAASDAGPTASAARPPEPTPTDTPPPASLCQRIWRWFGG